ncbi:hydrogenase 4 subunit B [Candidatus Mycobacterium methanotrophicum]|uniref:Hydrogenase 4 subunit B n=1 Tax=Candidatus Mycobacterium methanotrophicum TaxID=2943498 RepID=A0ABY4QHR2_9MYCO|nr:proton-conducting transporter membrane subunit [Candidatus Mycobacterium methanotrophicum]UQX09878.1 hydrogenase 4 subunit B [Candidatus Mycobacterium methanotrophicum]
MSVAGPAFGAALGLSVLAATAAVAVPTRRRATLVGIGTAGAGLAAVAAGVAAMGGSSFSAWLPDLLPLAGVRLALDPLGGLFVAVTGAVAVCAAVYGVGYVRPSGHGAHGDGRVMQATLPLFVAAMLLVPAAASVSTLLVAWELMALTSLLLVLAEHRRRAAVGEAGRWYAVMTHLGLLAILAGLVGFAAAAHGESFTQLRAAAGGMSPAVKGAVFAATLLGFASKAGVVPLHVWLPRAHPEAPSHVSALMSAAMVNLGVYGVLRVGLDLLRGGSRWWWLTVLTAGALSALYGILQAVVAIDLKRLLAYSTTENMGLVLIGIGAGGYFAAGGSRLLAALALTTGLLHLVNHAAFKTVLFCSAGSVLRATGSRNLDALGGLRSRMPVTTALFAVGALSASALPPGNGFVSEWLLLQSLIHALPTTATATAVAMPLAVAAVALTAGLAVATFVKAFGVGFLARPRSTVAEQAAESPLSMLAGTGLAAAGCVVLAIAPAAVLPRLSRAASTAFGSSAVDAVHGPVTLRLTGYAGSMSPLLITVALLAAALGALAGVRVLAARRARRVARLWDCGAGPLSARMEYTATSFAEPLLRVFDDVLAPETDVNVTPTTESAYLVERVQFQARVPDRIEHRLYEPVLSASRAVGEAARGLANGSVHRYLGYGFFAFTGLLIALAVIR